MGIRLLNASLWLYSTFIIKLFINKTKLKTKKRKSEGEKDKENENLSLKNTKKFKGLMKLNVYGHQTLLINDNLQAGK